MPLPPEVHAEHEALILEQLDPPALRLAVDVVDALLSGAGGGEEQRPGFTTEGTETSNQAIGVAFLEVLTDLDAKDQGPPGKGIDPWHPPTMSSN